MKDSQNLLETKREALPARLDTAEIEEKWSRTWEELGIHSYDPSRPRAESFVVDTPPPTVSGSLHIGHNFSYSHTDFVVRFNRMRGKNIFYPMGWDDNGLPTERRVQNYFNVQCDPSEPYEADLQLAPATGKSRKERARKVSRKNFIELCHEVTQQDEEVFKHLWRRLGLSVDWSLEYATIDDVSRRTAQRSFLDLHGQGHVYISEAPMMWDVTFQTAVAQAEVQDRPSAGAMHQVSFGVADSDKIVTVATTRPELLPACVGVTAHPDDERYADLFGSRAITPLFGVEVPIFPSELVDPEQGTGIVMVCTFGDAVDVEWWKKEDLALRQILGTDGRLLPRTFGETGWESRAPEQANDYYGQIAGGSLHKARKLINEWLAEPGTIPGGEGPALQGEPTPIEHAVKYYEKGDRPLEFITTRQWFVRLLDKKEALLAKGDEISWNPPFMKTRYTNWTEGLQFDWCISRQRYFGVPIPLWYPLDSEGQPDFAAPIIAAPEQLPVDPMTDVPRGYEASQRNCPSGFAGEADVFDTWFTSSMSPQITSGWVLDPERHARLFPFDIRPQSHEIIRTWAFYTIAKSMLHEGQLPWRNVLISGWVLDPDRKKMSKSVGNVVTPEEWLDRYSADGVRYWSANARLGVDTTFDESILKTGKRLVTKVFNAAKFVAMQRSGPTEITEELDHSFLALLGQTAAKATQAFERFEHSQALSEVESFFWNNFTDNYIELVKSRAGRTGADADSAVAALRRTAQVILRLFAPFLPFVTEEVWSWFGQDKSIHVSPWPGESEFADIPAPKDARSFEIAVNAITAIRRAKTEQQVSIATRISKLVLAAREETLDTLKAVVSDVMDAARVESYELKAEPELEPGTFQVVDVEFEEKEAKEEKA